MLKCLKCNKEFKYNSKYNEHKNRKTKCGIKKIELKCELCNINFKWPADKKRHENTKKHIYNSKNINTCNKTNANPLKIDNINNESEIIINNLKNIINNLKNDIKLLNLENNILKNDINNLNLENNILKQNNKIHPNNEVIYIIHCAQHINTNIYKVGRTKNIMKRFKQYPKGSELLYMFNCKNSKLTETNILLNLKENQNFKQSKEDGNEYFQCNLEDLKNIILQYL